MENKVSNMLETYSGETEHSDMLEMILSPAWFLDLVSIICGMFPTRRKGQI